MKAFTAFHIESKRRFYNFQAYLKFAKSHKEQIEAVRILPPKIGSRGFGAIEVEMKTFMDEQSKGFSGL